MDNLSSKLAEKHVTTATVCTLCGSGNLGRFTAETGIHFVGMEHINKPTVLVFPDVVVCLHCGFAAFAVPEDELRALANGNGAGDTCH